MPTLAADGMSIPLNVFLYQEIVRLQGIIKLVRETLPSAGLWETG